MSKPFTNKKTKVPKITEEEYAKYISSLKNEDVSINVEQTQKPSIEINQLSQK